MTSLTDLSPELQLHILYQIDTTEDLHRMIQASPRFYQIFLNNKDTILRKLAPRLFHPAILSDALACARRSQVQPPLSEDQITEFWNERDDQSLASQLATMSPQISIAMCKLSSTVRFFIEDYARNTLPLMKELIQLVSQSENPEVRSEYGTEQSVPYSELSDSEIGRLQRAFCRFETYRLLYARCSPNLDHDNGDCLPYEIVSAQDQCSQFLERYPDYEITEIHCIRDYLYRRLRGVFDGLEDWVAETRRPHDFTFGQVDTHQNIAIETREADSGLWLFCNSAKYSQKQQIEHIMSLGLPYIRRIFEATGEERMKLFVRHIPGSRIQHLETEFLTHAIGDLELTSNPDFDEYLPEGSPPYKYSESDADQLGIPDAWQWAHPSGPPSHLADFCYKGLRDWGYVFWGTERLSESKMLDQDSETIRLIEYSEYDHEQGPSVQERFLGTPDQDFTVDEIKRFTDNGWLDEWLDAPETQPFRAKTSEKDISAESSEEPSSDGWRDLGFWGVVGRLLAYGW